MRDPAVVAGGQVVAHDQGPSDDLEQQPLVLGQQRQRFSVGNFKGVSRSVAQQVAVLADYRVLEGGGAGSF